MQTSQNYTPNSQFALLLQGPPKSGKTSLVASYFPKPYIIDADRNINGALKVYQTLKAAGRLNAPTEVYFDNPNCAEDGKPLDENDRWLRLVELTKAALSNPVIETVCLDSLTTIVPILIAYILKHSPPKVRLAGEPMMEIQHWQPFQTLLTRLVMMCRNSSKKFVFCCHEEVVKDEVSGILTYRINMPTKLQHSFGALFTDCWRLEQIDNSKNYEARLKCLSTVRLPGLGNTLGLAPELNPDTFGTKKLF